MNSSLILLPIVVMKVDKQYLEWSYRAPRLLHLILQHQPHVICLQELNHFGTIASLHCFDYAVAYDLVIVKGFLDK